MRYLLALIMLLLTGEVFTQVVEQSKMVVNFSGKYEQMRRQQSLGYIGTLKEPVIHVHKDQLSLPIQKLSAKGDYTGTKTLNFKELGANGWFINFIQVQGKNYLFYSVADKKQPVKLYYVEINPVTGEKGTPVLLLEKENITGALVSDYHYYYDKFKVSLSADSSKLLVACRYIEKSSDDKQSFDEIGIHVFSSDFSLLWSKDIKLPYNEARMDNEDVVVTKNGIVYLLAKVFTSENRQDKLADGKPGYNYELIRIDKSGIVKQIQVKAGEYFISSYKLVEDAKGGLVCAGLYSYHPHKITSNGAYVTKVDAEGQPYGTKKLYEFPSSVISMNVNIPEKPNTYLISLRQVLVEQDGSIIIGAERYIDESPYFLGDVILMRIGAEGELNWCKGIRKYDSASFDDIAAFKVIPYNDNYYVFYTDNPSNFNRAPNEKLEGVSAWDGWLVYSKISKDGAITKYKVFDYVQKQAHVLIGELTLKGNTVWGRGVYEDSQRIVTIEMQ